MKPSQVSKAIKNRVREQIRKSLPIHQSLPEFSDQIECFLSNQQPLVKDPYLEAVPVYQPGATLKQLVDENVIRPRTAEIFACYFLEHGNAIANDVTLHQHQAEAVRQVCGQGKNLVVCSGTGSGKTETFLIPLIDSLVRENEDGELGDGVRAMILYPMNALVNDQIRRLRNVLRWAPEIRFGKFTGETDDDDPIDGDDLENLGTALEGLEQRLHDDYKHLGFDDEGALNKEVRTRQEWNTRPGHILVTNYSMLERLLLQPKHGSLFGPTWRFIVLDEAHCYSGALGTEIAWLIRRVQQRVRHHGAPRDSLRFLATSATLISDDNLTDEERAERIRINFAARLFPAQANSFAVQFGTMEAAPAIQDGGHLCDAARYIHLVSAPFNGSNLMEVSEECLGRVVWRKRVMKQVEHLRQNMAGDAALGDLLSVTSLAHAAAVCMAENSAAWKSLMKPPHQAPGLLDLTSQENVIALRDLVVAAVGPLNNWNKWRSLLHEHADPSPSSIPDDTYLQHGERFPKTIGNRLHLLAEWQQNVQLWSWEALDWLLGIAKQLAASTDSEIDPGALQVRMSAACAGLLQELAERMHEDAQQDQQLAGELDTTWAHELGTVSFGDFQQTMAEALRNDPVLAVLRYELSQANSVQQASRATATSLAARLFEQHAQRAEALDALVALATMAKEKGKRTPLLDIRYHQMIRGVDAPALHLAADPLGDHVNAALLPEGTGDGLTLGLCRDCGQPFALGYAETPSLEAHQLHSLSAERGARRGFLHAFIWKRGELPTDMEAPEAGDQQDLWLNTRKGLFRHGVPQQDGENDWVPVVYHAKPHVSYPEFIPMCPTCGEAQKPFAGSRYGIITPFEAVGDSVRVVAMEELAKQAGASGDPVARTLPGEGRKLLAFSDSRSGSASLALAFQDYHAETILEPLLILAAKEAAEAYVPTNEEVLEANGIQPADRQMYIEAPPFMAQQRQQWLLNHPQIPTYSRVARILENLLRQHNLGGLLSVAAVQRDNDGYEKPIGELSLPEAAQWRLLQALARQGRHSLRRRGILRISSLTLEHPDPQTLVALGLHQANFDTYSRVIEALLIWCIDKVELNIPDTFPKEGLQRYQKMVTENGADGTHRWVSNNPTKLSNYLRAVIAEETTFWHGGLRTFLDGHNNLQTAPATALVQRLYNSGTFSECVKTICSANNNPQGAGSFPANIAQNASQACKTNVAGSIREFFNDKASIWLGVLWPQFTQFNVLIAIGDTGRHRLNPDALLIHAVADDPGAAPELIPLRIEEHTAQLAKSRGSDYQRAFAEGNINILSCSTTFEMGVDLGDLSCVFLNGMPPSVANYRQRAGRAGRRPGSPSYVLTFLGRRDHDRYFWEHPEELLFAPLEEPKIYLENQIYRARHCRAEAFHDFLQWLSVGQRASAANAIKMTRNNGQVQEQPGQTKDRRWELVGDLFVGVTVASSYSGNGPYPVTMRFAPLIEELGEWLNQRSASLQTYLKAIDGIGQDGLVYEVAKDLIWQIKQQPLDLQAICPYPLADDGNEGEYRLLGGPNWPAVGANGLVEANDANQNRRDLRRCSVQAQIRHYLPDGQDHVSGFQKHLLREQTITWLSRCRVLPKYGFPVDVIQLLPDVGDSYGRNVKLERDLKIGLYEYAPEQVVVADKRRYRSAKVVVWDNGNFTDVVNNLDRRWICDGCHEPDWGIDPNVQQAPHPCRYCGDRLNPVNLCFPDAFQANVSTPSFQVRGERGTPIHVHTRAFLPQGRRVPNTGLITKESESGSITYINQGPGYRGFPQGGARFSLCHEVRTDIAGWMFVPELFAQGSLMNRWAAENCNGRRRLDAALRSAMQAILRATARVKNIEERDIQGLVQPGDGANGELGLVFFDDSTGGGGAVLDLVLNGNPGNQVADARNAVLIRTILQAAKDLCLTCICGGQVDVNAMPATREELVATAEAQGLRPAASCYRCLRSHRNQRDHNLLDRHDAAKVLDELLQERTLPAGTIDRNALGANVPDGFRFRRDDGADVDLGKMQALPQARQWVLVKTPGGSWAYGEWFLTERTQTAGAPAKRLRLLNGVGLEEGIMLTDQQMNNLTIWTEVP